MEVRGWDGRGHTHRRTLADPKGTPCPPTVMLHGAQTRQMPAVRQKTLLGSLWLGSCGFPNCKLPLWLQLQTHAMEASLSWTHTTLSQERVCVRRSFSMGWHTPIFCFPAVRGGRQVSQAPQGHPSWVRHVQEHSQARGSSSSLESLLVFRWHTCWIPGEGYRTESCLPSWWPRDSLYPVTATLGCGSHQNSALHPAGSMWS